MEKENNHACKQDLKELDDLLLLNAMRLFSKGL